MVAEPVTDAPVSTPAEDVASAEPEFEIELSPEAQAALDEESRSAEPEPDADASEEEEEEPAERSIEDIRAALEDDDGTVTGAEMRRLERHEQSIRDQIAEQERREQAAGQTFQSHVAGLMEDLTTVLEDAGVELSAVQRRQLEMFYANRTGQLQNVAFSAAVVPYERQVRADLLALTGNTPENLQAYGKMPLLQMVREINAKLWEAGKLAGPDDDHMVISKAQYKADLQAAARQAKSGLKAPPQGNESLPQGRLNPNTYASAVYEGKQLSAAEIDAMTASFLDQ